MVPASQSVGSRAGQDGGEHAHQNTAPQDQGLACFFTDVPGTWHPVIHYILLNRRKERSKTKGRSGGGGNEGGREAASVPFST